MIAATSVTSLLSAWGAAILIVGRCEQLHRQQPGGVPFGDSLGLHVRCLAPGDLHSTPGPFWALSSTQF